MPECLKFLSKHLKYPAISQENGVQGIVSVQFIVEKDGSISNPKVIKGVDPYLDKEALRVIKLKQRVVTVRTQFSVPVKFKLWVEEKKKEDESKSN